MPHALRIMHCGARRFQWRRFLGARLFSTDRPPESGGDSVTADDLIVLEEETEENSIIGKPEVPKDLKHVLGISVGGRPLFPGFYKTVAINDRKLANTLTSMLRKGSPWLGIWLRKPRSPEESPEAASISDAITKVSQVYRIGVFAQLVSIFPSNKIASPTGAFTAVVLPHRRISVVETVSEHADDSFPLIEIENNQDDPYDRKSRLVRALSQEIFSVLTEIAKLNGFFREHIMHHNLPISVFEDPSKLADFVAILSSSTAAIDAQQKSSTDVNDLQLILQSSSVEERLRKALEMLKRELITAQLQSSIAKDVEAKLSVKQREFFLHEQLRAIKKELGLETDAKAKLLETFRKRLASKPSIPEAARTVIEEELEKFSVLETSGSEFSVTRNYLDWLTQMPWGVHLSEMLDYEDAKRILDEDHYGLEEVKSRILEFIAVGKLRGSVQGKILCLVGPPGVGKTSIARSIARALNRKYSRFSVGGLHDVAEIKGHRRTYVGAMPGKVVQALKQAECENPLILIDEIDKLSRFTSATGGDPSAALLELLDPEQNFAFLDHYLDVPLDLSKVLFVATANVLDTIPGPLLDRMEIIQLSGYLSEEKRAIARNYLVQSAWKDSGLPEIARAVISDDALDRCIRGYCRENGVRNLKRQIEKIYRKLALLVVREKMLPNAENLAVTAANLTKFLGQPPFQEDRIYADSNLLPPGVVMGLAWTAMGGAVLYAEAVAEGSPKAAASGETHLTRTGQLGKVMEESSSIAYTFSKKFISEKFTENSFLLQQNIHLHFPEGAVSKDGPSAGITIATALISLALNRPVAANFAMTGELTLTGRVLKIGGLREKTVAARNSGVTNLIFPSANLADWEELPKFLREGITPHPVERYESVFSTVFSSK